MKCITVNNNNSILLKDFLCNIGEAAKTFRYFTNRDVSVVDGHLVTLLFLVEDKPIAYGHLEEDGGDTWLGICVLPHFMGHGYGKRMMIALIEQAMQKGVPKISLTVDKGNEAAINLYNSLGFKGVKEGDSFFKLELELQY